VVVTLYDLSGRAVGVCGS